jgi:hypothetical protein
MASKKCVPGHFCITKSGLFIILLLIILIGFAIIIYNDNGNIKTQKDSYHRNVYHPERVREKPINIQITTSGGDGRYMQAPQPLRDWMSQPELPPIGAIGSVPFGIATKGMPEKYQSVGIITTDSGDALPLYGRRTTMGGDRWNYYTRTDTYNPVQLPLHIGKRDCTEDIGCNEVSNGDELKLPVKGQTGRVTLYNNSGPRYYPGIL